MMLNCKSEKEREFLPHRGIKLDAKKPPVFKK